MVFILFSDASAQTNATDKAASKGRNNKLALNFSFPVAGYLKYISNMGIGAAYSWSKERFGKLASLPTKAVGFTFNIGIDYFIGEKEKNLNQAIKYGGTTFLHAYGGAVYNLDRMSNIKLTSGPNLEIYKGASSFGFGANFSGSFYLFQNKNLGLSPNFSLMKQGKTEVVLAGGVGVSYAL